MSPTRIFASIRAIDPMEIGAGSERLLAAGVDGLHVDVADGVFVPELTYGVAVAHALIQRTRALLDVHFMVSEPEAHLRSFAHAGITRASFHLESTLYPWRVCSLARSLGIEVGVALNPSTPISALKPIAAAADFILLLTTEPDFAGERLLPGSIERVAEARRLLPDHVLIEVDGGIDAEAAQGFVNHGVDDLVIGRAIAGADDWTEAVAHLRCAIGRALRTVNTFIESS